MPVWNEEAIDYSAGLDIYDPKTDTIYSELEANQLPACSKSRLILKPRKIGCYVMTTEEAQAKLKERGII